MSDKKKTEIVIQQRSVLEESRQAMQALQEAFPQLLSLQEEFGPEFAAAEVAAALRRNDEEIRGIEENFPRFREALLSSSPEIAAANDALGEVLDGLGETEIQKELQNTVLSQLREGGSLSAEEERNAVQTARSGLSARGLATGRTGVFAEVLNRDSFSRGRLNERIGNAANVDQLVTTSRRADAATAGNIFNTRAAFFDPQQRLYGTGGSAVSGQVNPTATFTPFLSAAGNVGAGNQSASIAEAQLRESQRQFNSERADAFTFFDKNAALTTSINDANNSAALKGATIGGIAEIAAALI